MPNKELSPDRPLSDRESAGESGVRTSRKQVEELLAMCNRPIPPPFAETAAYNAFPVIARRYLELEAENAELRDALETLVQSFEDPVSSIHPILAKARAALGKAGRAPAGSQGSETTQDSTPENYE